MFQCRKDRRIVKISRRQPLEWRSFVGSDSVHDSLIPFPPILLSSSRQNTTQTTNPEPGMSQNVLTQPGDANAAQRIQ